MMSLSRSAYAQEAAPPQDTSVPAAAAEETRTADAAPPSDQTGEPIPSGLPSESYGSTARVRARPTSAPHLELEVARDTAGSMGDPFRALDTLPGVMPAISGLPYIIVRGAPANTNQYFFDEIPLPLLFHLGFGPAVIHPRMVGGLTLYAGAPSAQYGDAVGAVIESEAPALFPTRSLSEFEVRALDVNGFMTTPIGIDQATSLSLAGRYGYPGLLLAALAPDVKLAYWDYQARIAHRNARDTFTVTALGSFDELEYGGSAAFASIGGALQSHRLLGRWTRKRAASELGASLLLGYQQSSHVDEFTVRPRLSFKHRAGALSLRAGLEFEAFHSTAQQVHVQQVSSDLGAFAEVTWRGPLSLRLTGGTRFDLRMRTDADPIPILEPRVRVSFKPVSEVTLFAAMGLGHAVASPISVLDIGWGHLRPVSWLETAWQAELGTHYDPMPEVHLELTGFVTRLENAAFSGAETKSGIETYYACTKRGDTCYTGGLLLKRNGLNYGAEVLAKLNLAWLRGTLSYTLSRAETDSERDLRSGLDYAPDNDIRHVFSGALDATIWSTLKLGARVYARSGRATNFYEAGEQQGAERPKGRAFELHGPPFVRLDAQVSYEWTPRWGQLRLSAEMLNATMSREALGTRCDPYTRRCRSIYAPAIFAPNISARLTW